MRGKKFGVDPTLHDYLGIDLILYIKLTQKRTIPSSIALICS